MVISMKILICDDNEANLKRLEIHVREYMKNRYIKAEFYCTSSASEAFSAELDFDLAFLDIQMPEIDGLTLAKRLKERNEKIILFFVTNYEEYQDDAMDLRIFRFFEKPFDVQRLYASLDRAMEYLNETYADIYLEKSRRYERLPVDDILYIKRENRSVYVVTESETFLTKGDFNDLISKLPNTYFYLVHKSFMVNVHHITKYSYKEIFVGNDRISVATRKQADFHKFWFSYIKRR